MSMTYAYVIPLNEKYIPDEQKNELILHLFRNRNILNLKIEIEKNDDVQFYNCGENLEYIKCPHCMEELDIEWWQEAMDNVSERNFSELNVLTPCCNKESSLNKLDYYFSQGFSMFAIKIEDFETDAFSIDDVLFNELERITGISWKVIYSRY